MDRKHRISELLKKKKSRKETSIKNVSHNNSLYSLVLNLLKAINERSVRDVLRRMNSSASRETNFPFSLTELIDSIVRAYYNIIWIETNYDRLKKSFNNMKIIDNELDKLKKLLPHLLNALAMVSELGYVVDYENTLSLLHYYWFYHRYMLPKKVLKYIIDVYKEVFGYKDTVPYYGFQIKTNIVNEFVEREKIPLNELIILYRLVEEEGGSYSDIFDNKWLKNNNVEFSVLDINAYEGMINTDATEKMDDGSRYEFENNIPLLVFIRALENNGEPMFFIEKGHQSIDIGLYYGNPEVFDEFTDRLVVSTFDGHRIPVKNTGVLESLFDKTRREYAGISPEEFVERLLYSLERMIDPIIYGDFVIFNENNEEVNPAFIKSHDEDIVYVDENGDYITTLTLGGVMKEVVIKKQLVDELMKEFMSSVPLDIDLWYSQKPYMVETFFSNYFEKHDPVEFFFKHILHLDNWPKPWECVQFKFADKKYTACRR